MSVLINMEMPKSCACCDVACKYYLDHGLDGLLAKICHTESRLPDCPLVHVPPHGRLIDADEISEHKYATLQPYRKEYADGKQKSEEEVVAFKFGWNNAIDAIIANAPTVIPASEVETC